ncbi:23S rRNA pseudouridine(1911/1915/1917) synthase RluD [Corallincola holothuriorum]|uniref:Pseudouridine synthase n=1 Tax=Corallincola holothuriorum TaxID=2282215 RepID=A0A368N6I9_9GAMM|nr:23S rRNA pseudouridine(1911/1915/1917) synthase RluD [Corallincola holothuriorum]RCU45760.1 23S rRNA pseudouridine(1911/1915/1917) synthase RluD [Corallincola holothuriorum]
MAQKISLNGEVPFELNGKRLDQIVAELFPDYSRSRIKQWILDGHVCVDGTVHTVPKFKLVGGERVTVETQLEEQGEWEAEDIPLDIVFEDEHILVINKPAGLVVHPGAGNPAGTVLNALLHHCPGIAEVPRAGIVHRLDKDTTGLMVVAKSVPAQTHLVEQLQAREITREYEALVNGLLTAGGRVDAPIGRHPTQRTHMAVVHGGRESVTHYRVMEKYRAHCRLRLRLETGRTHQIRVHMSHIKHPLVGDFTYGGRPRPPRGASEELLSVLRGFRRQALHAAKLELVHPITGEFMSWEAPVPEDMLDMVAAFKADFKENPVPQW